MKNLKILLDIHRNLLVPSGLTKLIEINCIYQYLISMSIY